MKYNRDTENPWEGFDGGQNIYDKKEEKSWHSRIWLFLFLFGLFMCLVVGIYLIREQHLVKHGATVTAEYQPDTGVAVFWDESGRFHSVRVSLFTPAINSDNTVTLYYDASAPDGVYDAIPRNKPSSYVRLFIFFGAIAALGLVMTIRIRKEK